MTIALPDIIGRNEASALGLKRFFTGEPCRHGHIVERSVSDPECMECSREHTRKYRAADPEKARESAHVARSEQGQDQQTAARSGARRIGA